MIGGLWRGRRLRAPAGEAVRPTAERVREALFDILAGRIVGVDFMDGYAGSGAIGIEALSREARLVMFVERDRRALRQLRANLAVLSDAGSRSRVVPGDLSEAISLAEGERIAFGFVYLDPPFGGGELDRALRLIGRSRLLADGGLVIAEHEARPGPPAAGDRLALVRTETYGRIGLSFFSAR